MVTSPSGQGVAVIGGYNRNDGKYSNALRELKGISSKEWVPRSKMSFLLLMMFHKLKDLLEDFFKENPSFVEEME